MKRIFLCILFFTIIGGLEVHAQNKKIDSLKTLLGKLTDDSTKVNTLLALGDLTEDMGSYNASDSIAKIALGLAQETSFKKGSAHAYRSIGIYYFEEGNYPAALKFFNEALPIDEEINNKQGIGADYSDIGDAYNDMGDYPESLQNYLLALKIFEETGDKHDMAFIYGNIGLIYDEQGNQDESLKSHEKSLKMWKEVGDKRGMSLAYGNIGSLYEKRKDYSQALLNQQRALSMDREIGNKEGVGEDYDNTGNIYSDIGNYPEALKNYEAALSITRSTGNKTSITSAYLNIGQVYTNMKKTILARAYLDSALNLSVQTGDKENIKESYEKLYEYYNSVGNYKQALESYTSYTNYRDSLVNEKNTKKLVQDQMNYDFEKKQEMAKAEQDKKDAVHSEELKKQRIISVSVTIGLLLLILFSGAIYRSLQQNKKKTQIIVEQKAEVEKQKEIVEEKNKEITASITYAKRLQEAILPPLDTIQKALPESFVLYNPKDIVAGDFYWMEKAGDATLIAAADCTGHGVPGAMVSVVCSNALNRAVKEFGIREPGKILDKVRDLVLETFEKSQDDVKDGMDISLCSITASLPSKEGFEEGSPLGSGGAVIQWAGAYNPLWYLQNEELKELGPDKQPIGKQDNPKPFTTHKISMQKGDTLYLFTDGYADQFGGPKGKKFKYKQLQELLLVNTSKVMNEQKKILNETFRNWQGELEQTDDVCIIGIRV